MKNISNHIQESIQENILDTNTDQTTASVKALQALSKKLSLMRTKIYHGSYPKHGYDLIGNPIKEGDVVLIIVEDTDDDKIIAYPTRLLKNLKPEETPFDAPAWMTDISTQEADKIFPYFDKNTETVDGYYCVLDCYITMKIDSAVCNKIVR